MSKVIPFPRRWDSPPPLDAVMRVLEEERRVMRRRWRREQRHSGRKSKRIIVTVGEPPTDDTHARSLWAFASALLIAAEAAFDVSVSMPRNYEKVLRGYVRLVRRLVRNVEAIAREESLRE